MMHTTCLINSQFNLPTCFFDSRFESNPLLISSSSSFSSSSCYNCCYCCCCCCCANSNNNNNNNNNNNSSIYYNSLPRRISPSFLSNGLRQSTLIQFSPSKKRLFFHGGRRQSCGSSNSGFYWIKDSDRNCYHEKLQSLKDRRKLRKGRYACWALEDNKRKEGFFSDENHEIDDGDMDDVEILLDLLTEEVGLENLVVKDRKRVEKNDRFIDRKRIEKNDRFTDRKRIEEVGLENLGVKDRKRVEKKGGFATGKTKVVKRDLKRDNEVVEVRCRKEDDRRVIDERKEEKTGSFVEVVNRERRRDGSSCSSYYSVSSAGEFESENDVEVKQDGGFVRGESSNEYKDDQKTDRYEEIGKEESEILKKNNTVETYYGNQEWRKKSEKKLDEESSQHRSHVSVNNERNSQHDSKKAESFTNQSQSRTKHTRLTENQYRDTEKKSNTSVQKLTSERRSETAEKDSREYEYKRQSNVVSESSRIQEIDMRGASSSSSREARMKNRDENVTEVSGQIEDRREEKLQRIDSRIKSQQISDTRITNTKNTRVSSQQELHFETSGSSHEARIKNSEEYSTEVSGQVLDRREEKLERTNQSTMLQDSRVKSQQISDTRITNTENTRFSSRQELHLDASSSAEKVTTLEKDQREEKLERMNQSTTIKDSRAKAQQISDTENTRVLSRQSDIRKETQELRLDTSSSAEKVTTSRTTTKASSFHVGMGKEAKSAYKALKLNPEPSLQETGTSGSRISKPTHEHSPQRFETVTEEGGVPLTEPSSFVSHEDAIVSADQQQRSSSHFVGEFVKKAKHELSTSEVQEEKKTREEEFVYEEDAEQHEDGSGNPDRKDGVRRGPSDEMWHETTASIPPPSETDAPDNTSSSGNGESVKKSGRSLWNVIGDVVRFRWAAAPRSETHASQSGGGGKGSSNQSTGSEAWFSGHEPEESNDDNVKTGSAKGRSQSKKEASNSNPSSSKDSPLLLLSSSSSNANQGSSSKHMSPSVIRMRRSPAVKITSGVDETEQPVPKMTETPPADASASGKMVIVDRSKDDEPKRRKLGRADQVSKDRFDEWEEAYNVETEQRKNDERFMREALLEAKKAADFWEVPVGAVLVQDGKIIARGYNLVEELRDSTAHAEMICIREASNNLRSWRLSGTTLYVTLEPCAMCAGAILQARIDTVVWGAPNKLLGADGSWIRLFPDGDGGSGSSDKPAAPVHPFHPNMTVRRGVLSPECADVMQQFFQLRRKKKVEAQPATPPPASILPVTHHHRSKLFSKMHDAFSIMFCL